jgi:hypothetical protein
MNLRIRCWVFTLGLSLDLKISQFLDGQADVSDGCCDPKQKKDDGHPWPRSKLYIKVSAYPISDEDGQGDLQAQAAKIGQLLDITPISLFQIYSERTN